MILKVKQKGLFLNIPGVAPFRTPAEVDISNLKIHLVVLSLKNNGVDEFEIHSKKDNKVYTKKDFEKTKSKDGKQMKDVEERFDRIERMIAKLGAKSESKKYIPEEQITNKLQLLEQLAKQILEKESVREVVYTSSKDKPVIEELDEDIFIPEVDVSELKLKGSSSETIGTLDDVDEAANALSQLKK